MGYIYKITNDINDKVYIGQTCCTVEERWRNHKWDSRKYNGKLYNAMQAYGIEHFACEMIEECENAALNERESYWIQYYNSYYDGYNATLGGAGTRTTRIAHVQDGQILKIYDNYTEAAKDAQCHPHSVGDVVAGRRNIVNGMVFRALDANSTILNPPPVTNQHKKHILNGIPVIATNTVTGEEFYFESIDQAAKKLGLCSSSVQQCVSGKQKQSRGYIFRRAPKQNHVFAVAIDDYNKSYAFPTQQDACLALGINPMTVSAALNGRKLTGAGCFWADHPITKTEWEEKVSKVNTKYRIHELSACNPINQQNNVFSRNDIIQGSPTDIVPYPQKPSKNVKLDTEPLMAEGESLADVYPEIAKFWHPTKNNNITASDITSTIKRKCHWQCPICGHEWEATINQMKQSKKPCLVCANKKVKLGYNDLATTYPTLAEEWHPTKNDSLKPTDVVAGSGKKVWWQCKTCGHEWQTAVRKRAGQDKTGCPKCKKLHLIRGINDLQTLCPEIAARWHPTKNSALTPSDVIFKEYRSVWWLYPNGKERYCVVKNVVRNFYHTLAVEKLHALAESYRNQIQANK